MELQLSVLVKVTPDERHVRLVTAGHLTETNQQMLYPLIHRARTLTADTEVVVDLTAVQRFEAAALDLLCWEVGCEEATGSIGPVRLALPIPLPGSGPCRTRRDQGHRTGSTACPRPNPEPA